MTLLTVPLVSVVLMMLLVNELNNPCVRGLFKRSNNAVEFHMSCSLFQLNCGTVIETARETKVCISIKDGKGSSLFGRKNRSNGPEEIEGSPMVLLLKFSKLSHFCAILYTGYPYCTGFSSYSFLDRKFLLCISIVPISDMCTLLNFCFF